MLRPNEIAVELSSAFYYSMKEIKQHPENYTIFIIYNLTPAEYELVCTLQKSVLQHFGDSVLVKPIEEKCLSYGKMEIDCRKNDCFVDKQSVIVPYEACIRAFTGEYKENKSEDLLK